MVKVIGRIAYITGMEEPLQSYPLIQFANFARPHTFDLLQLLTVKGHISAEDEPGYDFLCISLAVFQKVEMRPDLEYFPERRDVHVLEHRLSSILICQLRLPFDLVMVVGPLCIIPDFYCD